MDQDYDHLHLKGREPQGMDNTYDVAHGESSCVGMDGRGKAEIFSSTNFVETTPEDAEQVGNNLPREASFAQDSHQSGGDEKRGTAKMIGFVLLVLFVVVALAVAVVALIKTLQATAAGPPMSRPDISHLETMLNKLTQENEELNQRFANISDSIVELQMKVAANVNQSNNRDDQVKTELLEAIDSVNSSFQLFQNRLRLLTAEPGWSRYLTFFQYRITPTAMTWRESSNWCMMHGADLASIGMRNLQTRQAIGAEFGSMESQPLWIGLSDIDVESTYKWVDGVQGTSSNIHWNPGQPDNYGDSEDCCDIAVENLYLTNDNNCERSYHGLCEKRLQ